MHHRILGAGFLLAAVLLACSSDVTNEGWGGGGSTESTDTGTHACITTTSTSTGTGGPTGTGCSDWRWYLDRSLAAAIACQPSCDLPQCTGAFVVFDSCGCSIVANDLIPELADDALRDYDIMVSYCDPSPCAEPCPPGPEVPWYCDPDSNECMPQ